MIVVHHTASDTTMENEIKSTKRKRGVVPYHYLIAENGEIQQTRQLRENPGATKNKYANIHGIQIALIGNFNLHPPTEKQQKALRQLIRKIRMPVSLHREVGKTACPGKYFTY